MTQSALGRLRRFWLDVHLWLGVGLFVVLVPLGVSGAFLVWHDQIDAAIHPHRFAVSEGDTTLAASAYLDAARKAYGDRAVVTQLRLPQEAGDPVIASGRVKGPPPAAGQRPRSLTAWIDPATGKVLDVADTRDEVINIMHRLHGSLLITAPGLGRKIVGWLGWAMSLSCLTGLWLWWPRNNRVVKGLRWRRSPSTMNNLHHMFGFWVLIPLLLVSLTGVYISFPETSRKVFGVAPRVESPARGGQPKGAPRGPNNASPLAAPNLPIDMAVAAAMAEKPGARLSAISLPTEGKRPSWRIQFAGEGHVLPVSVQVSDADGAIVSGRGGPGQPDPVSRWMRKTHDAQDTPFIWQVLVFLTGVAPLLLGVTGTVMWLRRRSRRAHLKALQSGTAG
ncbi:MAG: PepSY domain-containing protein [Caulobacter sp.]|nr:PepSY domain-containing protein [Caulobacter sp.]